MNKIDKNANLVFYISPAIEHGIIWIVAWRITEQFYRPCICMKDEWDKLVASCRSPEFFSIIDLLDKFKEYYIGYGWHKQAAWFSISKEKFPEFRSKIMEEMNKLNFSHYKKEILVDKVIKLEELWFNFLNKVNRYKPFWIGNLKPVFMVENLDYEKMEFLGQWRDHLRFTTKHWFKIFAFYMWDYYEKLKIWAREWRKIDLIFDVSEDSWMGKKNLMLKVVDIVLN
jgi:single-stranded-DNA-specific exonuclease